jgi:membrane protease YdiL (CAAX protease family)
MIRVEDAARRSPIAWFWRMGAFVTALLFATMLARAIRFALTGRARLPTGATASAEPYFLLYRATGVAAVLAATWIVLRCLEWRRLSDVGLGGGAGAAFRDVAKGAALVSVIFLAGFACLLTTGHARIVSVAPNWRTLAFHAIPATALVALYEELLFRGYPFQVLAQRFRPCLAISVFALTFGALHYPNPGVTFTGAAATAFWSLVLGALLVRTRSLWTCIGFHFAGNFVQSAVLGSLTSGMTLGTSVLTVAFAPTWFAGSPSGLEASVPTLLAGAVALAWIVWGRAWAPRGDARVL